MPRDLYVVLRDPFLLAGMRYPWPNIQWKSLEAFGFDGVVCLTETDPSYDPSPLELIHRVPLEDLYEGAYPIFAKEQEGLVRDATKVALDGLMEGNGVIVHCMGGTGRTGTVLGCILREPGYSAEETIDYLDEVNRARRRRGWPESKWQEEMVRKY